MACLRLVWGLKECVESPKHWVYSVFAGLLLDKFSALTEFYEEDQLQHES